METHLDLGHLVPVHRLVALRREAHRHDLLRSPDTPGHNERLRVSPRTLVVVHALWLLLSVCRAVCWAVCRAVCRAVCCGPGGTCGVM